MRRHANFTLPLPTCFTQSCTQDAATESDLDAEEYQYIFYRTATVHQSHTPALVLEFTWRTGKPRPPLVSALWRCVPAVRHGQLAPFDSHDTYGYGLAWSNEMEPNLSQVGMNVGEDAKRISWLWMFT